MGSKAARYDVIQQRPKREEFNLELSQYISHNVQVQAAALLALAALTKENLQVSSSLTKSLDTGHEGYFSQLRFRVQVV